MSILFGLLYEERTGVMPFKKQTIAVLLRIPGVGAYIRRKQNKEFSEQDALEAMRKMHADASETDVHGRPELQRYGTELIEQPVPKF